MIGVRGIRRFSRRLIKPRVDWRARQDSVTAHREYMLWIGSGESIAMAFF